MTGRRGLLVAVVAVALGAGLVVLSAGRRWAAATLTAATGARVHVTVAGHDVAGSLPALGLALLALAVAVLATRRWLRRLVGVVVVTLGGVVVGAAVAGRADVGPALAHRAFGVQAPVVHASASAWSVVAVLGGVLAAVGGALTVVLGHRWPGMGARYDAPGDRPRPVDPSAAAWDSLDRGEDPTA